MMISQSALLCLEASIRRMLGRADTGAEPHAVSLGQRDLAELIIAEPPSVATYVADVGAPLPVRDQNSTDGRPKVPGAENAPLTPNERRARAAALRALALCRGRRFEGARAAFLEAARLDPELDLTRTPDFWKLERGAHEAAIAAYVDAGREGDAAVLRARVHSTYRPKPLRTRAGAVVAP